MEVDVGDHKCTPIEEIQGQCVKILKRYSAFHLAPDSGKVVVLDSALPIKHAFFAFVEHDVKSAPIWHPAACDFLGILTVSDFTSILVEFHHEGSTPWVNGFGDKTCGEWLALRRKNAMHSGSMDLKSEGESNPHFQGANPDQSIFEGLMLLCRKKINRLPVVQKDPEKMVLCILNHQRALRFLLGKFKEKPNAGELLRSVQIRELGLGVLGDECARLEASASVLHALKILNARKVPAVPIVDSEGRFLDAFTRSDVRLLALENSYDRIASVTVEQALANYHVRVLESSVF
jgi:5'-AMP-activated protein kinase regulatory gamma subunit